MRSVSDTHRNPTVLDASLAALVGDGANARNVLFKISSGELRGGAAKEALAAARYADWKASRHE